jgi:hypothetical protein
MIRLLFGLVRSALYIFFGFWYFLLFGKNKY